MPITPRGVRNNNPGNIDYNARNQWQGQLGLEEGVNKPRFARFDSPENGIRALAKLLINYRGKNGEPGIGGQGIDTVRETINRWAPPVENNTSAYVESVAKELGVPSTQIINILDRSTLLKITTAIIKHENGYLPYAPSVIAEGVSRALQ
jgi:hypothetical protein